MCFFVFLYTNAKVCCAHILLPVLEEDLNELDNFE